MRKVLLVANTDWYLWNFRRALMRKLRSEGWQVVLASPDGPWARRLEAEGWRWIPFEFSRHGMNPFRELGTVRRLNQIYRLEKPTLVHHFTIKCVLYGSMAAKWSGVSAVVNAITGLGTAFTSKRPRARLLLIGIGWLYKVALRGTEVIFQNPDDQQEFNERQLVRNANVHLIRGSGVDITHFQPATPLPSPPVVIVLIARLNREKGLEEYVSAARSLHADSTPVRFIAVGELDATHPQAIDETTFVQWKKAGQVEFLGHRDDVKELLQGAHIACLPSWGGEGVPRSLLEAMACGLPIVTTDVAGCRETVRHGDNGLLVAPRNASQLAEALRRLVHDPVMRSRMGARSRERAVEEFSETEVIARTYAIYERATLG